MSHSPSAESTRRRGGRRSRHRLVSAALTVALGVSAAIAAAVLTGSSRDGHPLVASSQRQPPGEATTPAPIGDGPSDAVAGPPDADASGPATPSPAVWPPGPREGAPGHAQGGATPPPRPGGPSVTVPILLYHYIRGNPRANDREGFRLSVTPANFARQMALLHGDGVHTISLGDLMDALAGGPPLPPRPVVLTFDDGHDDFAFRAVPVLEQYGFTATAFVVPGFLDHSSYLSHAQLQQVVDAGMTIGAHTMHHVNLARVSAAVAASEITRSRQVLQQLTGQPVDDFAYPYGIFTAGAEALVARAGFRDASTTEPGLRQYARQPLLLRRNEIGGYDTLTSFAVKAGLPPPPRNLAGGSPSPSPAGPASPSPSPEWLPSASPSASPRGLRIA